MKRAATAAACGQSEIALATPMAMIVFDEETPCC
jgi:hypothetical protein